MNQTLSPRSIKNIKNKLCNIISAKPDDINIDLFISLLTNFNSLYSNDQINEWIYEINKRDEFLVEAKKLNELEKWTFNTDSGDLEHESGGFFSIKGLDVKTNVGTVKHWTQPIIDQREIGLLGIIAKKINGIIHFLMQLKAEPGNINNYQLSPTVQSTKSNFTKKHKGKSTLYIEYFFDVDPDKIIFDQLQSEQGARFYHKRNRNIIILIDEDEEIQIKDNFRFLTINQISNLMLKDNVVNMDSRSVLSHLNYTPKKAINKKKVNKKELVDFIINNFKVDNKRMYRLVDLLISSHPNSFSLHSFNFILHLITKAKFNTELSTRLIPLNSIKYWHKTPDKIYHQSKKYFSIIGVSITSVNREIAKWDQPIIKQDHPGITGFICTKINGVNHYLIQLKTEPGVLDLVEISPTVQVITSNYDGLDVPEFLNEVINAKEHEILFDTLQSEEGGRFYKEENKNLIIEKDNFNKLYKSNENYIWMNIFQLKSFIYFNNYVNIEARSLISCLPSINK